MCKPIFIEVTSKDEEFKLPLNINRILTYMSADDGKGTNILFDINEDGAGWIIKESKEKLEKLIQEAISKSEAK